MRDRLADRAAPACEPASRGGGIDHERTRERSSGLRRVPARVEEHVGERVPDSRGVRSTSEGPLDLAHQTHHAERGNISSNLERHVTGETRGDWSARSMPNARIGPGLSSSAGPSPAVPSAIELELLGFRRNDVLNRAMMLCCQWLYEKQDIIHRFQTFFGDGGVRFLPSRAKTASRATETCA